MANEHLPVDPNVKVPGKVAAASAAADAIHKQVYSPQPDPAPAGTTVQPDPAAIIPPVTGPVTDPPAPVAVAPAPVPDAGEPGSWEHRYHSMKGRFDQSQVMIGTMQEQMSQMGDELMRRMERAPAQQDQPQSQTGLPPHIRLTEDDVKTYGPELLSLIQRAALDAVAPELGKTVSAVKQVSQRVQQTANLSLYQVLDRDIPDWRAINTDPAFKVWCGLPDVYSGVLKGNLLRNAFQAADAPRVVAFFKGYKAEQQATGQLPVPAQTQQQQQAAPREASVALESLVAPGRAKPASGDNLAGTAEKPIFTRDNIKNFYRNVQTGYYSGREQDKARDEAMIFAAQREGRVRG